MARLAIGAAHTSVSPGAIYKDLREFDLTRKLLELTVGHLEKLKVEHKAVPVDLQLLQRIDWINDTGYSEDTGDIFLEIHVNDGGKRGIEGWFSGAKADDNNSEKLADFIVENVAKKTKYESQGAKSEYDHELSSLLILNQTKTISVAVEFLYIDNEEDYKILKDEKKLDELTKTLAEVLKDYLDNADKHQVKKAPSDKKAPGGFGDFDFGNFGLGGGLDGDLAGDEPKKNNLTMDREERKKMITDTYQKLMGAEPKQNDLNYYLNIGVSEEQLIDKIVKSKEFEEMVKNAKEFIENKDKMQQQESDIITLKAQVNDLANMHRKLNELLAHKNHQIKLMQNELVKRGVIKNGEYYDPNRVS